MAKVKHYFSLIKFSHTIFAMPFAVAGYILGIIQPGKSFNFVLLLLVLACMVLARTAAMAFNRWADRDIDALNPRTQMRDIPTGKIKASQALTLAILSSLLFITCTFFINNICFYLSPVALIVVIGYSFAKRFTALSHFILGTGLSLSPIGAFLAVTGYFSLIPILLSVMVILWVSGFDIIYAIQDEQFDKAQKLHSLPSRLGRKKSMFLAAFIHLGSIATGVVIGFLSGYGLAYGIGLFFYSALMVFQHWVVNIKGEQSIAPAFWGYNSWAGVLFCTGLITEILLHF
ncbi:MAG: 4-hydroxybenzoate octaprenyltransferase [Bacteroidetes bacterium HGW-Bacteroidetes-21]|nr:MAG: 4-hydroxybenzoate octaprenyltransferase [Bacteroidetes bacterium HGW-Bacteroidetes-21]